MIGSLQSIARALGGEVANGQVLAPGPRHSGKDRSMAVKLAPGAPDGFVVFSHANDDPIDCKDYVRSKLGMPAFEPRSKVDTNAGAQASSGSRRIVATYDYLDEHGELLKQAVRYEPKEFRQRRPNPSGPGAWIFSVQGVRNVLYRLPDLLRSRDAPVLVAEGEKDADRLAGLGFVATTNIAGAGNWTADLNQHLAARVVFILADNDDAGAKHARKVGEHLAPLAAEVRVVDLPGLPEKGDVSDWLDAGNDPAGLLDLCRTFPTIGTAASDDERQPKRQHPRRGQNDHRPLIRVVAGDIARIVDDAEMALM